eukprot:4661739-Pyramimonas_sp.AAC.1
MPEAREAVDTDAHRAPLEAKSVSTSTASRASREGSPKIRDAGHADVMGGDLSKEGPKHEG